MNSTNQHFHDPRLSYPDSLVPGIPVAACQLCGDFFPISREEEARVYGYPRRPYVCPLCTKLMEEAEKSIRNGIFSEFDLDSIQDDHCNTNEMEVIKNEHYDQKCEPDEAVDDEYEELCHEFEADSEGGGSEKSGCCEFCSEAEHPIRIHVELLIDVSISIG